MTPDIIEMARQAGWTGIYSQWVSPTERQHLTVPVTIEQIEAFAELVAAKEREACANHVKHLRNGDDYGEFLAKAIRARGEA